MEDDHQNHAPRLYLSGLKLQDFRNYAHASLFFAPRHAVFTGENGAGERRAAMKPTNCVTRMVGPGVVSARPRP